MARIRSVKPEICESETMARLSAEVERTFVRLWTHCDDHGRAKDDPRLIVAALFPLHDDITPDVIDRHLSTLASEGLVVRYEVAGKRYLACPSWAEHQHPQKPRPSKIPAPDADGAVALPIPSRTSPVAVPDTSGPVVGGGEVGVGVVVDGGVEVAVADPSLISGDLPVPPDPPRSDDEIEQAARRALRLHAERVAAQHADDNPAGYAAKVRAEAVHDGTADDLHRLVADGSTAEEAVERLAAQRRPATPATDPAEAEAARERAHRAEEATAAKRAAITAPAVGDGLARIAEIRQRKASA